MKTLNSTKKYGIYNIECLNGFWFNLSKKYLPVMQINNFSLCLLRIAKWQFYT
jgi:hypothetical protein